VYVNTLRTGELQYASGVMILVSTMERNTGFRHDAYRIIQGKMSAIKQRGSKF
jgi:hypothetical protein